MAEKKKNREELLKELVDTGAEALAKQVLDLQDANDELTGKVGDVSKMRAEMKEYKRINKDQAAMLTALGKLSPNASPIFKYGTRYGRVCKDAMIEKVTYTAKQITENPALLKKLVDMKSGILEFSEEEEVAEETNA